MKALLGFLILFFLITAVSNADSNQSLSIGKYTAGCIKNSTELPESGTGYQVIRTSRKRNYANSEMVNFIKKLSKTIHDKYGANILIADISKEGGGPILDDHSSHQIGLDADILYFHNENYKELYSVKEREELEPESTLKNTTKIVDIDEWSKINDDILKTAAGFSEVDRIFVNPAIKKYMCDHYPDEEWLKKLRPWWGHDGHFHVRLSCPGNNGKCKDLSQPRSIECGKKLDWWFTKKAREEYLSKSSSSKTAKDIKLPKECIN